MLKVADILESRLEEFAIAESRDNGKPVSLARVVDIPRAVYNFRFFATSLLHHIEKYVCLLNLQFVYWCLLIVILVYLSTVRSWKTFVNSINGRNFELLMSTSDIYALHWALKSMYVLEKTYFCNLLKASWFLFFCCFLCVPD